MKFNGKLKHTFNGGEKIFQEQKHKTLHWRRNYETLVFNERKSSANGDDYKRLQIKNHSKREEPNQAVKLTVVK